MSSTTGPAGSTSSGNGSMPGSRDLRRIDLRPGTPHDDRRQGRLGIPLTGTVQVTVQLDNANHLLITAGRAARLAFDFNLAASNTVDLTGGTVQVSPTLVATVVPSDTKQIRVRGSLASAAAPLRRWRYLYRPTHRRLRHGQPGERRCAQPGCDRGRGASGHHHAGGAAAVRIVVLLSN